MEEKIITYEELLRVLKEENHRGKILGMEGTHNNHLKTNTPWLPAFLSLMWLTGGRVTEVLAIRGKDINTYQDESGTWIAEISLINEKQRGNRRRSTKKALVIIDNYSEAWAYVENYHSQLMNPDGLLFPRSRVTAWRHCKRIWGIGTHKAGRHSWVMHQARKGAQLLDIKQMGGWTRLESMNSYVHEFGTKELIERLKKLGN